MQREDSTASAARCRPGRRPPRRLRNEWVLFLANPAHPIVPARRTAGRQATMRIAQAVRRWRVAAAPARARWDEWLQSRCGRPLYRYTENVYSVPGLVSFGKSGKLVNRARRGGA